MGINYTIFLKFENPRRGRQARNLSENDPKILGLKSSSEQIIFRKLSLGAPVIIKPVVFWSCRCGRRRYLRSLLKKNKQTKTNKNIYTGL